MFIPAIIVSKGSGGGGGGGGGRAQVELVAAAPCSPENVALNGTRDVTFTFPADIAENDIVVVHVCVSATASDAGAGIPSPPAGWTVEVEDAFRVTQSWQFMCWYRADGTEGGDTFTIGVAHSQTSANRRGGMSVWRNCKSVGSPIEGLNTYTPGEATSSPSATPLSSELITTDDLSVSINLLSINDDVPATEPSGRTELYDNWSAVNQDGHASASYKALPTAGTDPVFGTTISGARDYGTITFALVPNAA